MVGLLGALPSPSTNSLSIGPLELRAYGLMIALGALTAVAWSRRRQAARGGDPEDMSTIALWAVPAGLVGSRLYHVATDWRSFQGRWEDVPALWQGGLGIPGGLMAGVAVGVLVARRRGLSMAGAMDVMVPTIPVAQAIGRWGNWFNQEVFGRPTDLPWALEIDAAHRPLGYSGAATFHPTFLYEGLWNVALAVFLVRIERRGVLRPGYLVGLWVFGYGLGRLWVEALRVDQASLIVGVRVNTWMALAAIVVGAVVTWTGRATRSPADAGNDRITT
ncbi:MAG: prolipoprotein diacylglyceryl transferase [Actinomycetota bacterium]|nr:prolipoprotein diacylglyceryl transferase [Acidimicrobiales bacterium]MEC8983142.1 prolipoprotein diacylglyceryl transferase [Actinomycetota bacterium]MEC9057321.1 prolipoprotein diacylglyceryl transferase [Actinomycetota bacterium]MEC9449434.1 prolipoprotein diacylglyceryl transferase [Actinomycetota bacterium]MED5167489.1 prolipoprotein diacylglyceryl transferase [Actinomycetota bacterium]